LNHSSNLPSFHSPSTRGGTYIVALWLHLAQAVPIGRLADIEFPPGWYLYCGSARGPGGLAARVARHRRRLGSAKRAHWHIDYLRQRAAWVGAWARTGRGRLECDWAAALACLPGAERVAPGFGASDCRCPAHLVRLPFCPTDEWFAAELGAERIEMDDDLLDGHLDALTTGDEQAREAAALALGRLGGAAIEPLADLLQHDQADVRWWAARALSEVGGEPVVTPLLRALGDPDPDVRACGALALGHTGSALAATGLAARLADDSAFVAGIAADALAMIGPPAVQPLIAMLAAEEPRTRLLAVRALARVKDTSAIGPLFHMLDDPSYLVRFYADEALEALGVGMTYFAP
jgi:Uri superfamily endonuclease